MGKICVLYRAAELELELELELMELILLPELELELTFQPGSYVGTTRPKTAEQKITDIAECHENGKQRRADHRMKTGIAGYTFNFSSTGAADSFVTVLEPTSPLRSIN